MATQKPSNEDLSQQFSAPFNTADMETLYESAMDSMLALMGRTVTVWLEPGQTLGTSNPDQHNPWLGGTDRRLGGTDQGGGGGSVVEPIFVNYTAHVVHGPSPIADGRPFELAEGDVQLTTVMGSLQDMNDAIEIEVDGVKYDSKKTDNRQIGFQTPKYLITIWSRKAQA